ncbi:ABC transporter substrate-binding protein [Humibacter antri]
MIGNITRRRRGRTARITAVAVAAASALLLSACSAGGSSGGSTSGTSSTPSGNATKGSISFWAGTNIVGNTDMNKVLIAAFEKEYPGISVKYIVAPQDTDTNRATLTTQISGGSGPDVFLGDVIWPAQFASHQLVTPLSNYLPSSYWKQFANGLVDGATYKGKVYAAPFFEDQSFLYYRKDILQANNLPVPTTWEQLVTEAKQVQAKGQIQDGYVFQGADYEGATCNYVEFLADAGGKVLNTAGTKSEVDSAAALKALTFEQSLVNDGVSPKAQSTFQEQQSLNEFSSGKALFLRNWAYAYAASQGTGSAVTGKVGIAPLPTFEGQSKPGYSNIGGWDLYMNPHTKNQAADLTFIKWMTGQTAQKIIATQFSYIPTNEAVRTTPDVIAKSAVLATVPKTRLVARPSNTPNYPAVSQAIYNAVNGVLAGSLQPDAAIKQMNSGITTALGSSGGL